MTIRNLKVKDIAKRFGYTPNWIRQLAQQNRIPGTKKGHTWLFNEEEVASALYVTNEYTQ